MKQTQLDDIVITGLGAVSAAGAGVGRLWQAALDGHGEAGDVNFHGLPVNLAYECENFIGDYENKLSATHRRHLDRTTHMALMAAREAWQDAHLGGDLPVRERTGLFVGTAAAGRGSCIRAFDRLQQNGYGALDPWTAYKISPERIAGALLLVFETHGGTETLVGSGTGGALALKAALRELRAGLCDTAIVVGADVPNSAETIAPLVASGNLTNWTEAHALKPFDRYRSGTVLGEGAGALILERRKDALARGLKPYCTVAGASSGADGIHPRLCHPDGHALVRAMQGALEQAGVNPDAGELCYVAAHGAGTFFGDAAEIGAIRLALGANAARVPVSSTKPITGHTWGAGGALEAVLTAKAMHEGVIPPTANYAVPDSDAAAGLDIVAHQPQHGPLTAALSLSSTFDGQHVAVCFTNSDTSRGATVAQEAGR